MQPCSFINAGGASGAFTCTVAERGGVLLAPVSERDISAAEGSQTGRYLLHAMKHSMQPRMPVAMSDQAPRKNASVSIAASAYGTSAGGQKDLKNDERITLLAVHGARFNPETLR